MDNREKKGRIHLELRFRVTERITRLPHYQGALWNAFFRDLLKVFVSKNRSMADLGVSVHPFETGVTEYRKNEPLHLGLSFSQGLLPGMADMIRGFNTLPPARGHFHPGRLTLEAAVCRVSGMDLVKPLSGGTNPEDVLSQGLAVPVCRDLIKSEAEKLRTCKCITLRFHGPLRFKSPAGYRKKTGFTYLDPRFFHDDPGHVSWFLNQLGSDSEQSELKVADATLIWLDNKYGEKRTTLGGLMGSITFDGPVSEREAQCLAAGQYEGIGKNRSFGLGFYILAAEGFTPEAALYRRGKTLVERAVTVETLLGALENLPHSTPGPDGLTRKDLKRAGEPYLQALKDQLAGGTFVQGDIRKYRMEKKDGGFREIHAFNYPARLAHKALADYLAPVAEKLLSDSSYAFRKGLNRKGAVKALKKHFDAGYDRGFKADITRFFESVDIRVMAELLGALFLFDDLPGRIAAFLEDAGKSGVRGIAQGSPLSPVLSNIYLDRFDKAMEQKGFRLVRYCDDFVVLFSGKDLPEENMDTVKTVLVQLGLSIREEKTTAVNRKTPFRFLGYEVTAGEFRETEKQEDPTEENWLPVFRDDWTEGWPVYLSSICRGAFSNGPMLVVNREKDEKEEINWNRVSRIVVVGRASFSGGVAYRALMEGIPMTFIDVTGRTQGHLLPSSYLRHSVSTLQEKAVLCEDFCLSFAREIVAAKIHNSRIVLKRNSVDLPSLKEIEGKADTAGSIETLMGFEGSAAALYFREFKNLTDPFEFEKRVYHPPDNPVNAMLSFGYTLLYNRLASVLQDKGFNPFLGFMHQARGRHFALASDLMEELRHVPERIVLTLIHRKEVKPSDFTTSDKGGKPYCRLNGEAFRSFIHRYETVMAEPFTVEEGKRLTCNMFLDDMTDSLNRALTLGIPYKALRIR